MAHDIYFVKEFLEAIRKVELVVSSQVTFLTAEYGLSLLNLMPRSREEMARLDAKQKNLDATAATTTFVDAKKAQKAPRLPPTQFDLMASLLTVYALFIKMLFTEKTTHLCGLNEIRRALMTMNGIQHRLSQRYLATISWAIINDACKHFSECMLMDDLVGSTSSLLIWPRSDL
mmetsp:Transcript_34257/g.72093  ORF Transcript_34257/g.72093 Transcript_34257/m.72093 type:complete len:174 (+) Transcript_34257:1520-2041(+)